MSAYGPSSPHHSAVILPVQRFPLPGGQVISVHHLTSARMPASLAQFLYAAFQSELAAGRTYPQAHPMSWPDFEAYFLNQDCFVGVFGEEAALDEGDRDWDACLAGAYYVKPNYPGRSSHICNAGFLVPPRYRGLGVASALARSYVENAPRLRYKASIFNLVYVDNEASVRIWDRLGFTKLGRIPGAGRVERADGGEDYVDAWIIYKNFEEDEGEREVSCLLERSSDRTLQQKLLAVQVGQST